MDQALDWKIGFVRQIVVVKPFHIRIASATACWRFMMQNVNQTSDVRNIEIGPGGQGSFNNYVNTKR